MNSNLKLPKGKQTLFDEMMIEQLIKDETFKASVEESLGKIVRFYPDWERDTLIYELLDGNFKYSKLSELVKSLNDMNYMEAFQN
jgi:hypothetical protein